jgi:hypothetical protein
MFLTKIFYLARLAKYVNVWAQPFSCQELMPDPFDVANMLMRGALALIADIAAAVYDCRSSRLSSGWLHK